jgi:hypothetical protein
MALNLAHRHAARTHGDDLLVEARETPLIARDQLGIEAPLTIAGELYVDLRRFGQHRLLRIAVAMIRFARRRLAFKMIVQLRVRNPLGQSFFQLVEKTVVGKHILRIAPLIVTPRGAR